MTPKMVAALSSAEEAFVFSGLERTVAGWRSTHPRAGITDYHSFASVNALVEHGYLTLYGNGKNAHISDLGSQALQRWLEARR